MPDQSQHIIRVWDLPTRVFHWGLVFCVVGLFITGKTGGAAMVWHSRIGYAVASLLLFRLAWGWMGGYWSRFEAFRYRPRMVLDYIRAKTGPGVEVGHSPLGTISVFALLIFLIAQVTTGLFSDDKAEFAGPLSVFVSDATARSATRYHKNVGQFILLALVFLHLVAIAYYQLRKGTNLLGPMWHGNKLVAFSAPASRDDWPSRLLAAIVMIACSLLVAWLVRLGGE